MVTLMFLYDGDLFLWYDGDPDVYVDMMMVTVIFMLTCLWWSWSSWHYGCDLDVLFFWMVWRRPWCSCWHSVEVLGDNAMVVTVVFSSRNPMLMHKKVELLPSHLAVAPSSLIYPITIGALLIPCIVCQVTIFCSRSNISVFPCGWIIFWGELFLTLPYCVLRKTSCP